MAKERNSSDEEIDAVNREIERIFDEMPPQEVERHLAEADESERRIADDLTSSMGVASKATSPTIWPRG